MAIRDGAFLLMLAACTALVSCVSEDRNYDTFRVVDDIVRVDSGFATDIATGTQLGQLSDAQVTSLCVDLEHWFNPLAYDQVDNANHPGLCRAYAVMAASEDCSSSTCTTQERECALFDLNELIGGWCREELFAGCTADVADLVACTLEIETAIESFGQAIDRASMDFGRNLTCDALASSFRWLLDYELAMPADKPICAPVIAECPLVIEFTQELQLKNMNQALKDVSVTIDFSACE